MFGRRKKNENFEWHKYVRTTIKLKREDRRRRIKDAQGAAVAGLRQAGQHSAKAGGNVAVLIWNWLANIGSLLFGLGQTAIGAVWGWICTTWRSLYRSASRLPAVPVLFGLGISLLVAMYVWKLKAPVPRQSIYIEGAGLALIVCGAFLALWPSLRIHLPAWIKLPRIRLPRLASRWRPNGSAWGAPAGILAAGLTLFAGWWFWQPAPFSIKLPSLAMFGGTQIKGRAIAVSGDTVRLNGRLIRLTGIEAPELRQSCQNGRGQQWACGAAARQAISRIVSRRPISCTHSGSIGSGSSGILLGHCLSGNRDVGAELVAQGAVFALSGLLFASYGSQEQEARNKRRGVWQGKAERPSAYRSKHWDIAKSEAPGGCPIKGQVRGGKRVYVAPWAPDYSRATVRQGRGERWFCSENEALAAGWMPVGNS